MYLTTLLQTYPAIAKREMRIVSIGNDQPEIPKGDYLFMEYYCLDKKCDCRRAQIQVFAHPPVGRPKSYAVLSYGWESSAFYQNWGGNLSAEELSGFMGPGLEIMSPQSPAAEAFLGQFKAMLREEAYRNQLIRHYTQVKYAQGMKLPKALKPHLGLYQPCGCGSGNSFKLCCGRKRW